MAQSKSPPVETGHTRRRRTRFDVALFTILLVLLAGGRTQAKPRVKAAAVDDSGRARVSIWQKQIFDEVGGKASLGLRIPEGLSVLTTDLTLPEEAGDISGRGWLGMLPQAVTLVSDFIYLPLKQKQLKLEVDYRSIDDEEKSKGSNKFSVDYPLSLEHVSKQMSTYLARTSYTATGHASWTRYTEGEGKIQVMVQDPQLKREKSDLNVLGIRVTVETNTAIWLHFEVVPGSRTAMILSSKPQLEQMLPVALRQLGIICQNVRVSDPQKKNGSALFDVQLELYNLRGTVQQWQANYLHYFHVKNIRREDVAAALATMFEIEFSNMEIVIRRQADHFAVDADIKARKVDQAIIGYLRLEEVLEPPLVRAGTHNEGLGNLVASINAVKTRRFRNVLVAAADSQDGGNCDYNFKLAFPKGHLNLDADFKYDNVLKAYAFASKAMDVPTVHQAYSLLQVHTTPKGLQGHYLYEAQGPWFDAMWALCTEASKGDKSLQAVFPATSRPSLSEGRLQLDLEKSKVGGKGWVKGSDLSAYSRSLLLAGGADKVDPLALDLNYDADKTPGKITGDVYLKAASREGAEQAIKQGFGKDIKIEAGKGLEAPALVQPSIEMPKTLTTEVEADRKLLGVTPWTPGPAVAEKPAEGSSHTLLYLGLGLGAAVIGVLVFLRIKRARDERDPWMLDTLSHRGSNGDAMGGPDKTLVVDRASMQSRLGRPLNAGPPPPRGAEPSPAGGVTVQTGKRLTILAGSDTGRVVGLPDEDLEVGRGTVTAVNGGRLDFAEPTISRIQVYLKWDATHRQHLLTHEAKATNPTLVNDQPVHRTVVLRDGDIVRMGRMVFTFEEN